MNRPVLKMSLLEHDDQAPEDHCRRLVLLGSKHVGKSTIVSRLLNDTFDDRYTPTVENFYRKIYRIRGEIYRLDILDTSGNHPFPAMRRLSFITGDMFLLVYDITDRNSFTECKEILQQLSETCSRAVSGFILSNPIPPPLILVGNKCDLEAQRVVQSTESLTVLAGRPCSDFAEISAKENINIHEMFLRLFKLSNLPQEMSPALHRKVTPSYQGSGRYRSGLLFLKRKISSPCGVIHPKARRPSVNSDLMMAHSRSVKDVRKRLPSISQKARYKQEQTKCVIL